jgi:flagellar biosynthesis protein FlhB
MDNIYALIGLIARIISVLIVVRLLPIQFHEMRRMRHVGDGFKKMRLYLLVLLVIATIMISPGVGRLIQLIHEPPVSVSASVASVTTNLGIFTFALMLYLIYTFKRPKP